jgi:GT2 family glycosyltransferase
MNAHRGEINSSPQVSLVIPTYQRCASVERLLTALNYQSLPPQEFEVIVVVDGSLDGTRELVDQAQTHFCLRGMWQPNRGRAVACNLGIRSARGRLIALLDDDMEPAPGLLEAHLVAHQAGPRLGVLGAVPISLEPSLSPLAQYIGSKYSHHLEKLAQPGYEIHLRDFYSGNFSIRRDVLMEAGLFDETFKIYGNEDLELYWRLRKLGVQVVYCAEALAIQHYEKNFTALAIDHIDKGKTSNLLFQKYPDALPELKLSTRQQESRKWRLLRAGLLRLSMLWKETPEVVIRFMTWLEVRRPTRLNLYYRLALDYFYWLGVNHDPNRPVFHR